ncbi:hypothetical protein [Methanosarcina sp. UBA5]|uniref:hypothetical protein n=1 Tax=Methanosarcina sp. UBA5 TaxID=1915593 RepID=UPI0025EAF3F8|nr:hypothetical protein [Methanosarcina sp. UBA5]
MHEGMMGQSEMHHGSMPEIWEMLTDEQKKEVALMKLDMKIQWMEMKISEMENMIKLKRKAIENIKKFREALQK